LRPIKAPWRERIRSQIAARIKGWKNSAPLRFGG